MPTGEGKTGFKNTVLTSLGTALAMFAAALAAQPATQSGGWAAGKIANGPAENAPIAELNPNGLALAAPVSSAKSADGRMRVRIKGPDGRTWKDTVPAGETFYWAPQGPDGQYRFEAMMVVPESAIATKGQGPSPHESKQPNASASKVYGTFEVRHGSILRPAGESRPRIESNGELTSTGLEQWLGRLLNSVVPAAAAETNSDALPAENFDDTDDEDCSGLWDFRIEGDGGTSDSDEDNNFIIYGAPDDDGGGGAPCGGAVPLVTINHDAGIGANSSEDSIIISDNGDINFANGDVFVDRDESSLGIGTTTPDGAPEIHAISTDVASELMLEESSSGNVGWLTNDGTNLKFEGTDPHQDIFNVDLTAPGGSLNVDSSGNAGIGTTTPAKQLHVQDADASQLGANNVMARIENTSGTTESRRMLHLVNNGSPLLTYFNTNTGETWSQNPVGGLFTITKSGTGQQEFQMDGNGNVTIQGMLTENSKRSAKQAFTPVDAETVLAKLEGLPIEEWSYRHSPESRHVGPMAGVFNATFGLGSEDGVAPHDMAGVALAAAKALKAENEKKDEQISKLRERNRELEARLAAVEKRLGIDNK